MWVASVLVYAMVVIFANLKVFLFSYSHFWFTLLLLLLSVLSFFACSAALTEFVPIISWLDNYDGVGSMRKLLINPNTYVSLVILVYGGFFLQPIFRNIKELHRLRTSKPTGIVADATEVDSSESDESQDNVPEMLLPGDRKSVV